MVMRQEMGVGSGLLGLERRAALMEWKKEYAGEELRRGEVEGNC